MNGRKTRRCRIVAAVADFAAAIQSRINLLSDTGSLRAARTSRHYRVHDELRSDRRRSLLGNSFWS